MPVSSPVEKGTHWWVVSMNSQVSEAPTAAEAEGGGKERVTVIPAERQSSSGKDARSQLSVALRPLAGEQVQQKPGRGGSLPPPCFSGIPDRCGLLRTGRGTPSVGTQCGSCSAPAPGRTWGLCGSQTTPQGYQMLRPQARGEVPGPPATTWGSVSSGHPAPRVTSSNGRSH